MALFYGILCGFEWGFARGFQGLKWVIRVPGVPEVSQLFDDLDDVPEIT